MSQSATIPNPPGFAYTQDPQGYRPAGPPQNSIRRRILVSMVAVTFLASIMGGLVYQVFTNAIITRLSQRLEDGLHDELVKAVRNNTRELPAVKEQQIRQIDNYFDQSRPVVNGGSRLADFLWLVMVAVLVVAVGSALLAYGVGLVITRRIVRPLEDLRLASQRVAGGDFSQRVKVERDDEVGQVASSFNLMATQLEGVDKKRQQLFNDIAHELKTPLASIQGHVEALRDNLPRARANPNAIYDIVLEDVAELDRMVVSLRSWLDAQNLSENLDIKSLNPREELPKILGRFLPKAENAGIKLFLQISPDVGAIKGDARALGHMLGNLVDNALRYTPKGGEIRLMAWRGEGEQPHQGNPNRVTLAVADTGSGIPQEHWPHLFERFYRVDRSRTRDTGGSGLGLAIVKELVEAQGGRIWLNSRVGQGTAFFISMPVA